MKQYITFLVNVICWPKESINDATIALEERFIGNCVESMGWPQQKDGMSINQTQKTTVTENDSCKLPWNFYVQTDHVIQARRPDVILIDKEKNECKIIDFSIPYDSRVNAKEMEKIE